MLADFLRSWQQPFCSLASICLWQAKKLTLKSTLILSYMITLESHRVV
jgi:hypothetical protein